MALAHEFVDLICRIGQGHECCRYLILGPKGFGCGKVIPEVKANLDRRVELKNIVARGDNCEGVNENDHRIPDHGEEVRDESLAESD